ncbi:hypothetical protein EDD16DRAFT_1520095 [Pisolithus croceorrhizus]|nr:hypothetical protein EDD16DRAFT_1520095 [Pisolithus croceorrhizus]KAI6169112.1 hypothetical protein EDD17DRAFT_1503052 [Pisolithus thermaeus]
MCQRTRGSSYSQRLSAALALRPALAPPKSNKEGTPSSGKAQHVNQELPDILGGHSSLMIPGGSDRLSGKGFVPWSLGTTVTSSVSGQDSSVMDEQSCSRVPAVRHSRGVLMALQFFARLSTSIYAQKNVWGNDGSGATALDGFIAELLKGTPEPECLDKATEVWFAWLDTRGKGLVGGQPSLHVEAMAHSPFKPWPRKGNMPDNELSEQEREEWRYCGLGDKRMLGFQCSCSS